MPTLFPEPTHFRSGRCHADAAAARWWRRSAARAPATCSARADAGARGAGAVGERDLSASGARGKRPGSRVIRGALRSEEHTSELQSLMRISYAVFCLTNKTDTVCV